MVLREQARSWGGNKLAVIRVFGATTDRYGGVTNMEDFRRNLSGWLPERIESALASYLRFTAIDAPEDIKSFAAHQAACRGSLAHIHLLVKLSRWIEGSSGPLSAAGEDELDRLRDEAETALKGQPLS